jgi:hypothetical protein
VHGTVVAAGEVALAALDLDHARPGVGQSAAAVGRRHRLLQRHHQQALQWAGRGRSVSVVGTSHEVSRKQV